MPVGVDSGAGKDIVPLDWLVPSRVPEYVTVQAAAGNTECEIDLSIHSRVHIVSHILFSFYVFLEWFNLQ